jgi:recombination protein RecR
MPSLPDPIQNLIDAFSRLPGIGPKSASRLTFFLLRAPEEVSQRLAEALHELKSATGQCPVCFNITRAGQAECEICADSRRDGTILCVVEEPLDVLALERTAGFQGRYHVLHGVLSPIEGIGPEDLKIRPLLEMQPPSTCAISSSRWGCGSPAWPAACQLAATWNMPIRIPCCGPSPAGRK